MQKPLLVIHLAWCLSVALITRTSWAEEAVVATDGVARMPIVLLANTTDHQRELARELSEQLGRISGATFEIVQGDGSSGIVLGTTAQHPMPESQAGKLTVKGYEGLEAFGIQTSADRVLILGASDLGLDHGVTRFLESLGCRWYFPNPAWHVLPSQEKLAVDLDLADRPALLSRVIWYGWGHWDPKVRADYDYWIRRNYMGGSLNVACSHAWQAIIEKNKETFDQHPEYLALRPVRQNGSSEPAMQRGGGKFCISNPQLVQLCRDHALDHFARNPNSHMVSMEPSDGSGHCECEPCAKMGPINERVHFLVNEVAKAVAERYPGKYVGTYAYHMHSEPPSFRMSPNVYVQITAGFIRGKYSFSELVREWPKHVNQLGIYEYFNVWAWTRDMPGEAKGANIPYLRKQIPYYVANRATTMSCESGSNFGPNGLGYLVASRLMWNPQADVDAVCSDFYERAFEAAAAPMRRYYERFDGGHEPLLSDHLMALAHADLAEASSLAAGRPDVLRRLDDLKLYLYYVQLMRDLELTAKGDREGKLGLTFKILNLAYRTRHRYIINSAAVRGRYRAYLLGNVKPPDDWNHRSMGRRTAWYQGDDYTHDEVELLFRGGLSRFKARDFEDRSFFGEMVPVPLAPIQGAGRACFQFQSPFEFVVHGRRNEPLNFRLLAGWIAHYRDRRPTEWKMSDMDGNVIASGQLSLTGEWSQLEVMPPKSDAYQLHVDDFGAGWGIETPPGLPCVWKLKRTRDIHALCPTEALYFYVPKGTRQVAYYVRGNAHSVLSGDGTEVGQVAAQAGDIITLPVPAGQDGQAWCLKNLDLSEGKLWFLNCPNYIAASADELMVPADALAR